MCTRCRNCHEPLTPKAIAEGADACSVRCVREFVIRGRGRTFRPGRSAKDCITSATQPHDVTCDRCATERG